MQKPASHRDKPGGVEAKLRSGFLFHGTRTLVGSDPIQVAPFPDVGKADEQHCKEDSDVDHASPTQLQRCVGRDRLRGVECPRRDVQQLLRDLRASFRREAIIGELRLITSALDQTEDDLGEALVRLRQQLEVQAQAANLELGWAVPEQLSYPLDPRAILDLTRAIQEVVSNAVRHAHARGSISPTPGAS